MDGWMVEGNVCKSDFRSPGMRIDQKMLSRLKNGEELLCISGLKKVCVKAAPH